MKDNQFVYQWAEPTDVNQIVTLFELCLGADGGAPTVTFWNWKHHQNPGGISPVILAWDGDKLIGIRAFMCFKFHNKKEVYKAYRPVDTATHPDYQGKGIFRNLTMSLIDDLKKIDEKAFIFNTPNSLSKPGYIKMGWKEWGKPVIQIMPSLSLFGNFKKDQAKLLAHDFSGITVTATDSLTVYKDAVYYQWRYQQISIQSYGMKELVIGADTYRILYRQKKIKFLNEFRICDIIKNNTSCQEVPVAVFVKLFFAFGAGFVSFINKSTLSFTVKLLKKSPMVTFRKINDQDADLPFTAIDWSIGELELF
ncbi:GNAT family N-acetyltransferase [Flavobacterium phycosphaerae]|uniref:GNAT family N-acetyltransferase n=1 Tax=Flavobacterium phycosphaerae TaxID=2697515 RepID=UPI001389AD12|nr:GNAT family N-acetyltransferase [Flavobacterium phycosphaerae]